MNGNMIKLHSQIFISCVMWANERTETRTGMKAAEHTSENADGLSGRDFILNYVWMNKKKIYIPSW